MMDYLVFTAVYSLSPGRHSSRLHCWVLPQTSWCSRPPQMSPATRRRRLGQCRSGQSSSPGQGGADCAVKPSKSRESLTKQWLRTTRSPQVPVHLLMISLLGSHPLIHNARKKTKKIGFWAKPSPPAGRRPNSWLLPWSGSSCQHWLSNHLDRPRSVLMQTGSPIVWQQTILPLSPRENFDCSMQRSAKNCY